MAYQAAIPAASDAIATSQADIQNNFGSINSLVQVNHVGFNTADAGKHSQITFPSGMLVGQPFTYNAGEIGLQSRSLTLTGVPDIWMSRGVAAGYPATGKNGNATDGWSFLPSGLILKWGTRTVASGTPPGNSFILPTTATDQAIATLYTVLITPASNITVYNNGSTATTLSVGSSGAGVVNFLMIGV